MDATFDRMFYPEGEFIGGIDESGVSDIAGPLVAACVILPKVVDPRLVNTKLFEVNDSKQIPEKYREEHAEVVWSCAIAIGIGEVSPSELDYLDLYAGTRLAILRAIAACTKTTTKKPMAPDFLLIDGNLSIPTTIKHKVIEKADTKSLCVASASVVAKVYRDNIMLKLHDQYPYYDWLNNKGYPCENQFQGMDKHGIQIGVHRVRSWPFLEKKTRWINRRQAWRKITEQKTFESLGARLWTTKRESSMPSAVSKSSQESAPTSHP